MISVHPVKSNKKKRCLKCEAKLTKDNSSEFEYFVDEDCIETQKICTVCESRLDHNKMETLMEKVEEKMEKEKEKPRIFTLRPNCLPDKQLDLIFKVLKPDFEVYEGQYADLIETRRWKMLFEEVKE